MKAQRVPGLAACIVKGGKIVWSKGYGWANIKKRVAMDPNHTIQNIASISKTVTATAVMQLWEKGKFRLDDDVNKYLPFSVRNPSHPDEPISFRMLLTHRSSIKDNPEFDDILSPGDYSIPLATDIKNYFTPAKKAHFHLWSPDTKYKYSNVGFGLLGCLVEKLSGESFTKFTKARIFDPLGMKATAWMLADIDSATHAVPYVPVIPDRINKELASFKKFGILGGEVERDPVNGGFQPLALYSYPGYPAGTLRTSVNQFARFLLAYVNNGVYGGARILEADTVRLMLTRQDATKADQGLCWFRTTHDGQARWGHDGSDPGVDTDMSYRLSDGVGVIVFTNSMEVKQAKFTNRLFKEAARF